MRKKILIATVVTLLLLLAAFVFRPWSPWSPWKMLGIFSPATRVENFQHMDRIFPFRELSPSTAPYTFPRASSALPGSYMYDGETRQTAGFMEKTQATGLLVLRDGVLVHEEYHLGAGPTSTLTSWSMAKSVVGTLAGIALKEGHIHSLDDPAERYVPELQGQAYGKARIRDLLRMASGVRFDERYNNLFSDIRLLFYRVFLLGQPINHVVAGLPAEDEPGTRFHYKSVDSQVLAWVVSAATKRRLSDYAQEKLWQPLGMQDAAFWNLDRPGGTELAYCCLNLSLRDYAKLGQLYLQQGNWNGQQLLPDDWVREATQRPEPWLAAGNGYPERGYGYHWWVPRQPDQEFFANGIWGQTIFVDEKSRTVIVKTSVDPDFAGHTAEMIAFMRGIVQGLVLTPAAN